MPLTKIGPPELVKNFLALVLARVLGIRVREEDEVGELVESLVKLLQGSRIF